MLGSIASAAAPLSSAFCIELAQKPSQRERDPRLLQLRSVYGSGLSKMQPAREPATKLIAKRHAEAGGPFDAECDFGSSSAGLKGGSKI